jgi:mitochondrial fission protein ELM1
VCRRNVYYGRCVKCVDGMRTTGAAFLQVSVGKFHLTKQLTYCDSILCGTCAIKYYLKKLFMKRLGRSLRQKPRLLIICYRTFSAFMYYSSVFDDAPVSLLRLAHPRVQREQGHLVTPSNEKEIVSASETYFNT